MGTSTRRKGGLARAGALVVAGSVTALSMLPSPEAEADCNRNCPPGVEPDARGCCPVSPGPGPVTGGPGPAPSKAACTDGRERNDDTAGHCCWSGQVWANNKCVGVPRACPKSTHVDRTKESCEPDVCPSGMVAPANAKTECCWPGQAWSKVNGVCVGTARCPKGFEARGDTCADLEAERRAAEAKAQREQARIDRERREAADRAELDRKVAAERAEREKREAAERVEHDKREAAARAKAEIAREEERRRMEHAARLSEARTKAEDARGSGKVALGFGIGSVALSGLFMGLGAMENGSIHGGGFATGADVQSAADKGKAFNITAAAFGVAGGVLLAVSIPVIALNHEPKDSDVALTFGPFGGGVRGSF